MSRARTLADLFNTDGNLNLSPVSSINSGQVFGAKNLIINGAFQVWQRGTSHNSSGVGSADRWYLNLSGGTATASQSSFTDGQTDVPGNPAYFMNLNVTTGNDNCGWQYRREGTWQFANDVYTLSFYAKSADARQMTVASDSFDSSADVVSAHTVSPSTFTPTSSWQRFTFKITHSNMSGLGSYANGDWTRISISQGSDTSTDAWQFDIWGMQLEKGEEATDFEHIPFDLELHRCKRYFQKTFNYDTAPENGGGSGVSFNGGLLGYCGSNNSGTYSGFHRFDPEMRANPSVTTYGNSSGHWGRLSPTNTGTVSYSAGSGYISNTKASGINFGQNAAGDTLLIGFGHITASAEL